ncbi:MAG: Holliday junction branch migration protein RuvA [Parachlamydiaceae bacterium]|nr:Holliday junction branch migration protein RuvA [Parachlamydiaceae bacterium]
MYAYIKGILVHSTPLQATIDVKGVGYCIYISSSGLGQLPQIGEPLQLYTSFVVREFVQALYGFITMEERDIFECLLNVTGVGPKLALSLIGHLPPSHLHAAIAQEDIMKLCKVPGVGKKTAERLIIELRDKLSSWSVSSVSDFSIQINKDPRLQCIQDAILALVNLGYNQSTAQKAVKQSLKELPENAELSTLITASLQNI